MNGAEVLREALTLKAEERFVVIEGLLRSLDEPSKEIDDIWAEEAEKRLKAVREGRLETIPMDEVFAEEQ